MFEINEWLVAENKKQLQEAKDSDEGWVPLHPDIAKGPGGWITTGCESSCNPQNNATLNDNLVQDAYLQLLDQRKNGKDKKAVEVGGKIKSPGFFQRWFGGGN